MSESKSGNVFTRRLPLILLLSGLLILLLWIGLVTYRIYRLSQSLEQLQNVAQTIPSDGINTLDFDQVESLLIDARRDIAAVHSSTKPIYGILPYLSWIPEVGPLLASTPELMMMADIGSYAAIELLEGFKPAVTLLQNNSGSNPMLTSQLLEIVEGAEPNIRNALKAVERMSSVREELGDAAELPWRIRTILDTLDQELPTLENALRLSTVLPEIMGKDEKRSYLIIAQNEDEIRPTGGFISGAGLIVVEDGGVISIEFSDANLVDDYLNKPYDFPPQPFFEFMGMDIFLFRDSNFWPDFPVSAEQAMDLYTLGQDTPVDGVIAIDQEMIKILLDVVGPLFVPELERTLAASNVISEMRAQWNPTPGNEANWMAERKAFMGPMADAIRQRIEDDMASIDVMRLIRSLENAANQRHLQIYMRDPAVADVLAETGWDGHFENPHGQDYLLVVDMSLGFNKVSAVVDSEISYHVTLLDDGRPTANLTMQYTHNGEASPDSCWHGTAYTNQITYSDLLNDCYWNYVRVYAPIGSDLTASSHNPVPAEQLLSGRAWEGSARLAEESTEKFVVFDAFYLVEQGQEMVGEILYALPDAVSLASDDGYVYRLEVGKQAGVKPHPISIRLTLPAGADFVTATPEPAFIGGQDIVFSEILSEDMSFEVFYR